MSDRITTTCQHSHTVTLRLNEGEWYAYGGWIHTVRSTSDIIGIPSCDTKGDRGGWAFAVTPPPAIRAELEAALAAVEASCGGCGCAERLRDQADLADQMSRLSIGTVSRWAGGPYRLAADFLEAERRLTAPGAHDLTDVAAEFGVDLDAAPDARGENT